MLKYKVVNVAHGRHNRSARSALAANPRMKQHIGSTQMRCLPGRPVFLSQEQFDQCLPELRDKVAAHIFEVRTADGRLLDLDTMEAAAPVVATPLVHRRPDSVEYDKPSGIVIPPHQGEDGALPQVLKPGAVPDLLQGDPGDDVAPLIQLPADPALDAAITAATSTSSDTSKQSAYRQDNQKNKSRR